MKKDFEYKVNEKWLLTPFGADERVLLARAKFMLETNKLSQIARFQFYEYESHKIGQESTL